MSTNQIKPSLSEDERAQLRTLYLALKPFRDLDHPQLPMSYVTAALLIALDEGLGASEYADKLGVSVSVMTRNILDIGERNRQRGDGLGLVTQERDLLDLRKHRSRLTPRGKKLMHDILDALKTRPKA